MDSSNSLSDDSFDSSGSVETIVMDSTSSVAGITSEALSYTSNPESNDDAAPYQFKPSTESLDISSEESHEEGEKAIARFSPTGGKKYNEREKKGENLHSQSKFLRTKAHTYNRKIESQEYRLTNHADR